MGLFDSLENTALSSVLGGGSSPLAAGVLQMIQNRPGGLQGLVQSFHDQGLGGVAASWVGNGANSPITSDQIHQVLGSEQVKALAARAGINPDTAGAEIAQVLPLLVNHLTPNGAVPDHGSVMDLAASLLKGFETKTT